MKFEFATANQIIFGPGTAKQFVDYAGGMGRQAMLVTGKNAERADFLVDQLESQGIYVTRFSVTSEPTTTIANSGSQKAREVGCDIVIGFGGGSVIDTGKVIAALLTNSGDLMDYLEVIGQGQPLKKVPVPYIAVPTTAGTGSEVTRNAVLDSSEHGVKVSMRSPLMLPRLAIIDPELTYSMPPAVTAGTGLDALTQLIESFVSIGSSPITDGICREGMKRVSQSLERAYRDGDDREARENMSLASLFGGLALANAKLGAVHGIAGSFGGTFKAPHGAVCGRLLPYVIETNVDALRKRSPDSWALDRYEEIARILAGNRNANAGEAIKWVKDLCSVLNAPPLSEYGLTEADFPALNSKSQKASSMKGNPIQLTEEELELILKQAM